MKNRVFCFILAIAVVILATLAFAMEESVLAPSSFIFRDGVIFSLKEFSKEDIRRSDFSGYRWEWVIGIKNTKSEAAAFSVFSFFENDAREAFGSDEKRFVAGPGEEILINQEAEFWGLLSSRGKGRAITVFGKGDGVRDNFKTIIRLD